MGYQTVGEALDAISDGSVVFDEETPTGHTEGPDCPCRPERLSRPGVDVFVHHRMPGD